MLRTAYVTNAKRPLSGEMAVCFAAARHEIALALSQPRQDRYEGESTLPGKAPTYWSFRTPGIRRSHEARSPAGTGLFVWRLWIGSMPSRVCPCTSTGRLGVHVCRARSADGAGMQRW